MSDHQTGGTASNHHIVVSHRSVWDPEVRTDQLSSCQAFRIAACRSAKARCPQQLPHEEMPQGLHSRRLRHCCAKGQRLQRDRGRCGEISSKWQRIQVTLQYFVVLAQLIVFGPLRLWICAQLGHETFSAVMQLQAFGILCLPPVKYVGGIGCRPVLLIQPNMWAACEQ